MEESKFGIKDKRGNYKPVDKVKINPPHIIPFEPIKFIKFLVGWNGYIFPWQFIWASIAILFWFFLTPSIETMKSFEFGWVSFILVRNCILIFLYISIFHFHFYVFKSQGNLFKFNGRPLESNNSKFLFRNQTKDNLFWVFCFALPIWSTYEVLTYWLFANNFIPIVSWDLYPVYCIILFFLVPILRDIHFYLTHRLLHWAPLYKIAHKVHHLNSNPGPWSGMAMHPIELILYFSGVIIHWIIPSHPLIAMYHIFHAGLSPHAGHSGYEKMVFKNGKSIHIGAYDHYLHHKYFECNYAGGTVNFLDKFFGTFHDGSEEATRDVMQRIKSKSHYL